MFGGAFLVSGVFPGNDVSQDGAKKTEWLEKACDGGLQAGCNMYRELVNNPQDLYFNLYK